MQLGLDVAMPGNCGSIIPSQLICYLLPRHVILTKRPAQFGIVKHVVALGVSATFVAASNLRAAQAELPRTEFPPPPSTLIAHLTAKLTSVDREVDGEYIGKRGGNVDWLE